ncbi:NepR family anti-sigma factor [Stappia sp.]|jgi:hypothetical protein|uniref:NepR family anti-sigma factor n=1 Tax=Stappia sp. TaxID=1870903 RepID=UPI003A9943B6
MADLTDTDLRRESRESVEEDIHLRIGTQLKAYYDQVLTQPVPDRFDDLLRRLDEQSNSGQETR